MTKAYISEYAYAPSMPGMQLIMAGHEPAVAVQVVDYTAGAAASSAFNAATKFIRVNTDAVCSFRVSTAGTAATTSFPRMSANATEFFGVEPGDKISFITNT